MRKLSSFYNIHTQYYKNTDTKLQYSIKDLVFGGGEVTCIFLLLIFPLKIRTFKIRENKVYPVFQLIIQKLYINSIQYSSLLRGDQGVY